MPKPAQNVEQTNENAMNELGSQKWAVISFDRCEASRLTYEQAAEKLRELETRRIAGLCVVTAETAARVND